MKSKKTIYATILETANMFGVNVNIHQATTLNTLFDIVSIANDAVGTNPKTRYFSLGLEYGDLLVDGVFNIDHMYHTPEDGSLFKPAPFISRPTANDLVGVEREQYRLRKIGIVGGVEYAFYFAKVATFGISQALRINNLDGSPDISVLDFNRAEILNPTPTYHDTPAASTYVANSLLLTIGLSPIESQELISASKIYYGDSVNTKIAEGALVSGSEGSNASGVEILNAQITYFVNLNRHTQDVQNGFYLAIEVGGMSPMATHVNV